MHEFDLLPEDVGTGVTVRVESWFRFGPPAESLPVEKYLTSKQAAAYIGVHIDTFREWVRLGKFPRVPLPGRGKDFRFSRESIDAWAKERELGSKGVR
jgi:excisionase family DNA binding protein